MPRAKITSGFERWLGDKKLRLCFSDFYQAFPKQQEFHRSRAKYRLFGGAAGPGKSKALLMEAILQANEHAGADTLLLRRTFSELETSLLLYFRRDVPREFYRSYNESKHVVTWRNGSTTRFGYCNNENDVYQYQGAEFLFIGIDELTLFTLRQWQFLTSRNRCPVPGAFPCMAGATNPGNIGHAWVKSLWIDKQPAAGMERPEEYDPTDYAFISARVWDNPIYAADANYLKTLQALPRHLRQAFLEGDWNVFAGQYFDRFDPSIHTERAENIGFEPWWPRWISVDWGFEHPAAAYWHASAPLRSTGAPPARHSNPSPVGAYSHTPLHASDTPGSPPPARDSNASPAAALQTAGRPDSVPVILSGAKDLNASTGNQTEPSSRTSGVPCGTATPGCANPHEGTQARVPAPRETGNRIITYRELVRQRVPPRTLAQEIIELSSDSAGRREHIDAIYLSPDAFAHHTDEASIAEQMGDVFAGNGFPRPICADNDRIGGWMLMYQMLDAGEWLITGNCADLIRVLPTLVRDPARVEDIEKMEGDDPADAARYGLKSRVRTARPPLEQRLAQRVTSADPTVRAIQARKAQLDEQLKQRPVSFRRRAPRR
jgi:hypothetical protein